MPIPANLSFVGIAKETTKGTGVVPTAFIPVTTLDPVDNITYFDDTGMRGAMVDVYDLVQGPRFSEVSLAGNVHPDTFPWLLAGIMGDVATTGASAPFTHTISTRNGTDGQPISYSLTDHYGLTGATPARRYSGCQFAELTLKYAGDAKIDWSAKAIGFGSTKVARPTASFGAIAMYPSWLGTVTIGGTLRPFVQAGEISIKRGGAGPVSTVNGVQSPYVIWVGPLEIEGKLTLVHEDDTELDRFLNGTNTVLVHNWTTGTAAALTQLQLTMSKVQYKVGAIKRGKQYIELEVDYKALANTTDVGASGGFGAMRAIVQNAVPAATYV